MTVAEHRRVPLVLRLWDAIGRGVDVALGPGAAWARGSRTARVVLGWLLTRGFVVLMYWRFEERVGLDVEYYFQHLTGSSDVHDTLREYPVAAAGVVALPLLVASSSLTAYRAAFIVLMLLVDAAFTAVLHRHDRAGAGVTVWLAAAPAVGPLLITRFDVVPGAAVAAAVLLVATRPRLASLLTTLAVAVKLWPVLLFGLLAGPRPTRRRVLATGAGVAVVVAGIALALGGLDRSVAPLDYQARRGLQIESLPALPLMALWSVVHAPWTVGFSDFVCSQVSGPGDTVMLALSSAVGVAVVVLAGLLTWRIWRRTGTVAPAVVGWSSLAVTTAFVVTNKVFSPQYMLWLLPLAAVLVALDDSPVTRRVATSMLVVGVLGQVVYPGVYPWVSEPGTMNSLGVALLVLRLAPLVVVALYAVRHAWRSTAATVDVRAGTATPVTASDAPI